MSLNPKQLRFCQEYVIDLNGTKAAERAGYKHTTAGEQASRLLANHKVQAEVIRLKADRAERTQVTADWVLEEYRQVWEAKITDVLVYDGEEYDLRPLPEWPDIWQKMTTPGELRRLKKRSSDGKDSSWDDVGQQIKFSVFPKSEALKRIGEHVAVNAFPTKSQEINLNVTVDGIEHALQAGRKRLNRDRDPDAVH